MRNTVLRSIVIILALTFFFSLQSSATYGAVHKYNTQHFQGVQSQTFDALQTTPPLPFSYSCQAQQFDIRGQGMFGQDTATISDIPANALWTRLQFGGAGSAVSLPDGVSFTVNGETYAPDLPVNPGGSGNVTDPDHEWLAPGPDRNYYRWGSMIGYRVEKTIESPGETASVGVEDVDETAQGFVAYSLVPSDGTLYSGAFDTTLGYAWGGNNNTDCSGPTTSEMTLELASPLEVARDVTVKVVIMEKDKPTDSDQRTVKVYATAGGVTSAAKTISEPDTEKLNIVELTIPSVQAGTQQVRISLESPCSSGNQFPNGGDSTFLIGAAAWYVCEQAEEPEEKLELDADAGYANIQLDWNASSNPDTVNYQVSRAISGTAQFNQIAVVNETQYFDEDGLDRGTKYCYQVSALSSDSTVLATSNVDCATLGSLQLWVPDVWAAPGTQAIVPINIRNADELQIASTDIWLDFNSSVIEPISVTNTALTNNYGWMNGVDPYGAPYEDIYGGIYKRVKIASISQDDPPPKLYGEGSLFWVLFEVKGNTGDESILNLREFIDMEGGSSIYAYTGPDTNPEMVPLSLEDGTFSVDDSYMLGDIDGDGLVTSADAYIATQIGSGKRAATAQEMNAGDVNGDGKVGSADATMILSYAATGEWPDVPEEGMASLSADTPIDLIIESVETESEEVVDVAVWARGLPAYWAGGDFTITYDQSVIERIESITLSEDTAHCSFAYNNSVGVLKFSLASYEPINTSDIVLVNLKLRIAAAADIGHGQSPFLAASNQYKGSLNFADASLNDTAGRDLSTSALQQPVHRQSGDLQVDLINRMYLPQINR